MKRTPTEINAALTMTVLFITEISTIIVTIADEPQRSTQPITTVELQCWRVTLELKTWRTKLRVSSKTQ